MTTGTADQSSVSLDRDARFLRESLSRCRRDVSSPITNQHVENLIRRLDNDRIKPCDHIVEVLHDAFSRGGKRADVEAFFRAGMAMVAEWYDDTPADVPQLIRLETEAQAVADMAEIDAALEPSPKTIADMAERLRGHLVALDRLVGACERQQFAADRQRRVA